MRCFVAILSIVVISCTNVSQEENDNLIKAQNCLKYFGLSVSLKSLKETVSIFLAGKSKMIDLSPLKSLRKLRVLGFANFSRIDISKITNLSRIEQLEFSDCTLTNVEKLRLLKNLKKILFYSDKEESRFLFIKKIIPKCEIQYHTNYGF